jgi:kinesin light chain
MSQDDILQSTKSVIQGLDALKNEHGKMLENVIDSMNNSSQLDNNKLEEKAGLLRKSMDMIELGKFNFNKNKLKSFKFNLLLGIGEAQVMVQLGNHLQNLEAEKQKLRTQVKRLCQENAWLRDELASTQKKLHDCEQSNASYSVEIEHLKFLKDVKQYDSNENNSPSTTNPSITNLSSGQTTDLVNDLFPNDDDMYMEQQDMISGTNQSRRFDSYADLTMSPSQSATGSFISTTGYEIPARLKTLHNLVIQYASQGRYEVAVPLCRQALEDLEKTSGHQRMFEKLSFSRFVLFLFG